MVVTLGAVMMEISIMALPVLLSAKVHNWIFLMGTILVGVHFTSSDL